MNIQPGRMNRNRSGSTARRDPQFGRQLGRVVAVVLFLALISSVLAAHIFMKQKITEKERRIREAKLNISRINTELVNLRNQYEEKCSFPFIRRQIVRFNLNLVPAEPGQVVRMAIYSPAQAARLTAQRERGAAGIASRGNMVRDPRHFRSMTRE